MNRGQGDVCSSPPGRSRAPDGSAPEGYQRRELGLFPAEWSVGSIGELFDFLRTASNSRADLDNTGDTVYVHYGDIHTQFDHFIDFSRDDVPCLAAGTGVTAALLRNGDLIVADASEDETGVGKSVEVRNLGTTKAVAGLHTFLLRPKNRRTFEGYRGYLLEELSVKNQLRSLVTGLKVFGISKGTLKSVLVPLPPPPEQRAISKALSDVDGLLETMEELIAKKRAIKQAITQQLFSGKSRLSGFFDEWPRTALGRVGGTYGGLSGKSGPDFGIGNSHYVTFLGVLENIIVDVSHTERVLVAPNESQNSVLEGDLLINGTSETPEDLAMGSVMGAKIDRLYLNSFCFGFRIRDTSRHVPMFLAYLFRSTLGRELVSSLAQGATRYNLSKAQFLALEVPLPAYEEQREIVAVLSDFDAEIDALERRRDKVRAVKQGVMERLLTGRVRLV